MTILIHVHPSHSRTFKVYYTEHVQVHLIKEFPHLVSYPRFVALIPQMLFPLLAYLQTRSSVCTAISFIDSTSMPRLSSQTDQPAPRLCHGCQAWQEQHGLVLWVQAAPGGQ
ncbi:MAG: hypothetical protein NVS2B2_25450 [Ktedonobacteraceae bacterium]